jgi:hypothetical protein
MDTLMAPAARAISAATSVSTVATITTVGNHGFVAGQYASIQGVTPAEYNGVYLLKTASTNTLTYDFAGGVGSGTVFGNIYLVWQESDDLIINNGALVEVTTNQTKAWKTIQINNGELRITNTSTASVNRFLMGQRLLSVARADRNITLTSGLAKMTMQGDWIQIGTGSGNSNQTLTLPTSDYYPAIWVETSAGSNVYESWLNWGKSPIEQDIMTMDGIRILPGDERGKGFYQTAVSPSAVKLDANAMFTDTIQFGDGVYGAKIPTGAKVRVPNLIMTDVSNIQKYFTTNFNWAAIVPSGGGLVYCDTVSFVACTHVLTNAQVASFQRCAFAIPFAISACNGFLLNDVAIAPGISWPTGGTVSSLGATLSVSTLTSVGTACTATTVFDHGYETGEFILIAGATPAAYNGTFAINVSSRKVFTYTALTSPGSSGSGTITVDRARRCTITSSGLIATVVTSDRNKYTVGLIISIANASPTGYNGEFIVQSVIDDFTFTYNLYTPLTSPATGTIQHTGYSLSAADLSLGLTKTWLTIPNAQITKLNYAVKLPRTVGSVGGSLQSIITLQYADGSVINGVKSYAAAKPPNTYGFGLVNCNNVAVDNFITNGAGISLITSSNNTFNNTVWSPQPTNVTNFGGMAPTSYMLRLDPATGQGLVNGTRYYVKTVFRKGYSNLEYNFDSSDIVSRIYSVTPYEGGENHPFFFGANPGSNSVILKWCRRDPTPSTAITFAVNGTSVTQSGTTATLVLGAGHPYVTDDIVVVSGINPGTYNGTYVLTGYTATTISYTFAGAANGINGTANITSGRKYEIYRSTTFGSLGSLLINVSTIQTTASSGTASYPEVYTDTTAVNGTTYYYTLRKYDSYSVYTDSAQQEATPTVAYSSTNLALRSYDLAEPTWVYTGTTRTYSVGAAVRSNYGDFWTGNRCFETLITASTDNGKIEQTIATTADTTYTLSVWLCVNPTGQTSKTLTSTVSLEITDNGSSPQTVTQTCNLTRAGGAYQVSITTSAGSTNCVIRVGSLVRYTRIYVGDVMFNEGATTTSYVPTTTTALSTSEQLFDTSVVTNNTSTEGGIRAVSYGPGQTIAVRLGATPANIEGYVELHLSTDRNFVPSRLTKVAETKHSPDVNSNVIRLTSASNFNTFSGLTQYGVTGFWSPVIFNSASNSNVFKQFSLDSRGQPYTVLAYDGAAASNFLGIYDCDFNGGAAYQRYQSYTNPPIVTTSNLSTGLTIQNVRTDLNYETPINTVMNSTTFKGVGAGLIDAQDGANAGVVRLGSAYPNGFASVYTGCYDNNFYETYWTATTGALTIIMNASASSSPPYTVLSGTPRFQNDGTILFGTAGDSIEFTWPNTIIGVSGFRSIAAGLTVGDVCYLGSAPTAGALGDPTSNDSIQRLGCIKIEYSLNTGSGYGDFKRLTVANLTAETVSATTGFNLKLRMTAMRTIPFTGQSTAFNVGETINGATSGATAVVDEIVDNGTTGHLWVSSVTGDWGSSESIRQGVTARANTVAAPYQILPVQDQASANSRVYALQIFTTVDQTAKYPISNSSITISNIVSGSKLLIRRTDNQQVLVKTTVAATSYSYTYGVLGSDIPVEIILRKASSSPYYQEWRTTTNLGSALQSISANQLSDE